MFEKMFHLDHGQDAIWNLDQDMLTKQIIEILRIFKDAFIEFRERGGGLNVKKSPGELEFPKHMRACATVCGRLEKLTCMEMQKISYVLE